MSMQPTKRLVDRVDHAGVSNGLTVTSMSDVPGEIERAWQRFTLRFLRSSWNSPSMAIGVTSAVSGEGRTTGGVSLALGLAEETRLPVILLGVDSEGYGLAEAFGLPDAPDLRGVLRGNWTLMAALSSTSLPNFTVLPAWTDRNREHLPQRAYWSALREAFPGLLQDLKNDFAYVVCDLPPLLENSEAIGLAGEMNALVMLTRAGVTPLRKLEDAAALLDQGRIAGVVHIGMKDQLPKWLSSLLVE